MAQVGWKGHGIQLPIHGTHKLPWNVAWSKLLSEGMPGLVPGKQERTSGTMVCWREVGQKEIAMTINELRKQLTKLDRNVRCFYEDPMTEAMGAPTGDFQEDFDRKERSLCGRILNQARKGSRNYNFAFARFEKFMP
jgi:hypothetical protein